MNEYLNNTEDAEPIELDDVAQAAWQCHNAPTKERRAYRDRLIVRCRDGGDVTWREVGRMARSG